MLKLSVHIKVLSKYLLAAILLAIPLYPKFPLLNIPGTFVAIRLEDILLLAAATLTLFSIIENRAKYAKNELTGSIVLYLAICSLSLFMAIFVLQTVVPHIGILHVLRRIEYFFAFFFAVETLSRNPKALGYYLKLILLIIGIATFYGAGQRYFNFPIIITQNEEYSKGLALRYVAGSHINSTFAGHYDLASFLVLTLPIVVSTFFIAKGRASKIFTAFTFIIGLWLLASTASRISFLSYMIAVSWTMFLIRRIRMLPIILIVSIAFIGTSSNLIARYSRVIEVYWSKYIGYMDGNNNFSIDVYAQDALDKMDPILTPSPTSLPTPVIEDRSTNIRLSVEWPRALRAFLKNPLLGTGVSSITLATDNDYLRLLGETGMLGFLAFALIIYRVVFAFYQSFPLTKNLSGVELIFVSGVFGALPGVLLNAVFIDLFEASKFAIIFWLLIGLTYALVRNAKK